jgi:ketosteroid isomerase-like protein
MAASLARLLALDEPLIAPGRRLALALQRTFGCPKAMERARDRSRNVAAAGEAYRLRFDSSRPEQTARSIDDFLGHLAPDVEFAASSGPWPSAQGRQAVRQLLLEAGEQWEECSFAVEEMLELDVRHVLACGKAVARPSGQTKLREIPFVNLWTFEAGRAVRIESFVDRRQAIVASADPTR